jgi:hypothetical protein
MPAIKPAADLVTVSDISSEFSLSSSDSGLRPYLNSTGVLSGIGSHHPYYSGMVSITVEC